MSDVAWFRRRPTPKPPDPQVVARELTQAMREQRAKLDQRVEELQRISRIVKGQP